MLIGVRKVVEYLGDGSLRLHDLLVNDVIGCSNFDQGSMLGFRQALYGLD